MPMFSSPIEIQPSNIRTPKMKEARQKPAPYSNRKNKKKIAKELEEGALNALKDLLAKQKQKIDILHTLSAAGPFSDLQLSTGEQSHCRIQALDPSAQVMQLFEKLASTLLILHRDGIQETTLFLDGDPFASSIFQGAKITITEYNTAPKVFNVQFFADPKALALFETHAASLLAAFQNGNFGFQINRIDTSLLTEDEAYAFPKVERDLEKEEEQEEKR